MGGFFNGWGGAGIVSFLLGLSMLRAVADEFGKGIDREVVVYTALDQIYSEPILKAFESRSGIRVRPVYDSEAAKTVGLVSRLRAERERPRCDVFWNNEILRTLELQRENLLAPHISPATERIPAGYRDPEGYWTGFAARLRVIAYNTDRLTSQSAPRAMADLIDPRWRGKLGIAYPLFGTTATHGAVLFSKWGEARAREFFQQLKANDIRILEGNMTAARAVADGELDACLTDSDDANLLQGQGYPIGFHPVEHEGGGALLIPNTVALVKGCPHAEAGRALIDYLVSAEVEAKLAASASVQIPLQPDVETPEAVERLAGHSRLELNYSDAALQIPISAPFLKELFSRE